MPVLAFCQTPFTRGKLFFTLLRSKLFQQFHVLQTDVSIQVVRLNARCPTSSLDADRVSLSYSILDRRQS